jgi:hypothetical protein
MTLAVLLLAILASRPGPVAAQTSSRALRGRIKPEWLAAHVRFLSDRLLEGRETGTRGAELAAKYVAAEFEQLGLAPLGPDRSFLLPVELRRSIAVAESSTVALTIGGHTETLTPGLDYVLHADQRQPRVERTGGIAFVGWGITAPDAGYDDYRGQDVTGKFVALLPFGPPSLPPDERGYYGGFGVKERNAIAHGAIGVIMLMPGLGPEMQSKLGQLDGFAWVDSSGAPHSPFFETGAVVRLGDRGVTKLFAAAGRSFGQVVEALGKGPQSFPIDASLSLRATFAMHPVRSFNVAGLLEGSDPRLRHEYVVYSAHLDHVGIGNPVDGDSVYHGAIDNAGGTAGVIALARAFAGLPRPKRSLLFLAVTGEEKGILGSDYFVHLSPVPLSAIVADLNLDNFVMKGPIRDFVAYGARYSSLSDDAARAFRALGVTASDDPLPAMTIFTRSDHYAFMRVGVPGLMLFPGTKSGQPSPSKDNQREYFAHVHHTPLDRMDQGIDWAAGVTFTEANLLIGYAVADAAARPRWRPPGRFFFSDPERIDVTP